MKKFVSIGFTAMLLTAYGCREHIHIWGTGEDFRRVEFADILSDSTVTADSLAIEMGGGIRAHAEDVFPKTGTIYIEPKSGDRWTIDFSDLPDSIGYGTARYAERNGYRAPDYHRLDLALNFHFPHKRSENGKKGKEDGYYGKGGWLRHPWW